MPPLATSTVAADGTRTFDLTAKTGTSQFVDGEKTATSGYNGAYLGPTLRAELGEKVALTDQPAAPDGTLRLPAESWLRLITGRLSPEHTPAGVEIDGPLSLDDLRKVFPGF